jgi:hypothetical protein
MKRIAMALSAMLVAACAAGGTLDNVPGQSPATVTNVNVGGPISSERPDCPARLDASSCPATTHYGCEADRDTGCVVCTCGVR